MMIVVRVLLFLPFLIAVSCGPWRAEEPVPDALDSVATYSLSAAAPGVHYSREKLTAALSADRTPEEIDEIDRRFQEFDAWIATRIPAPHMPSFTASFVYKNRVLYQRAINAEIGRQYPVVSFTKLFTATCVLRLAGQQKLSLDESVQGILPGYLVADGANDRQKSSDTFLGFPRRRKVRVHSWHCLSLFQSQLQASRRSHSHGGKQTGARIHVAGNRGSPGNAQHNRARFHERRRWTLHIIAGYEPLPHSAYQSRSFWSHAEFTIRRCSLKFQRQPHRCPNPARTWNTAA
jgi:hypothetical protein